MCLHTTCQAPPVLPSDFLSVSGPLWVSFKEKDPKEESNVRMPTCLLICQLPHCLVLALPRGSLRLFLLSCFFSSQLASLLLGKRKQPFIPTKGLFIAGLYFPHSGGHMPPSLKIVPFKHHLPLPQCFWYLTVEQVCLYSLPGCFFYWPLLHFWICLLSAACPDLSYNRHPLIFCFLLL